MGQCIIQNQAGGGMTSTLLWTNPSPGNGSMETITINVNLNDYTYLGFMVKSHGLYSSSGVLQIMPTSSIKTSSSNNNPPACISSYDTGNGVGVVRTVERVNNNQIRIVARGDNRVTMPLKMYGIKGKINGI